LLGIGKNDDSREDAKLAKFEEDIFLWRSWRLGAIKFFEVVLLNKNRICIGRGTSDGRERLARRAKSMGGLGHYLWSFQG